MFSFGPHAHCGGSDCVGREHLVLDEQDHVDKVTNAGVVAVTEIASHGVELFGRVPIHVDDFNFDLGHLGEGK